MTPGNQALSAEADSAVGGAVSTDCDEVQALLLDIFALTGQKVQADDPLVAAALIHSALLRRAGEHAAQVIKAAVPPPAQGSQESQAPALSASRAWLNHFLFGIRAFSL